MSHTHRIEVCFPTSFQNKHLRLRTAGHGSHTWGVEQATQDVITVGFFQAILHTLVCKVDSFSQLYSTSGFLYCSVTLHKVVTAYMSVAPPHLSQRLLTNVCCHFSTMSLLGEWRQDEKADLVIFPQFYWLVQPQTTKNFGMISAFSLWANHFLVLQPAVTKSPANHLYAHV